jgi:hypothetical protein
VLGSPLFTHRAFPTALHLLEYSRFTYVKRRPDALDRVVCGPEGAA